MASVESAPESSTSALGQRSPGPRSPSSKSRRKSTKAVPIRPAVPPTEQSAEVIAQLRELALSGSALDAPPSVDYDCWCVVMLNFT